MNTNNTVNQNELQELLGMRNERILQLTRLIAQQQMNWENDATEWRKLKLHRRELGEWIVDQATTDCGSLQRHRVDAELGGEEFVPCAFRIAANNRRYQLTLICTEYQIEEIDLD